MLFSFICMAAGGFLGVASTILFVSLPEGLPQSMKKGWVQVPRYRSAIICLILGLIFTLLSSILLLSF